MGDADPAPQLLDAFVGDFVGHQITCSFAWLFSIFTRIVVGNQRSRSGVQRNQKAARERLPMRKLLVFCAIPILCGVVLAAPAFACGGLSPRTGRSCCSRRPPWPPTTTGLSTTSPRLSTPAGRPTSARSFPCPAFLPDVRRGGSWTLQRLEREPIRCRCCRCGPSGQRRRRGHGPSLLQTTVDALDITVLSGGGPAVLDWVKSHGYAVSADAPAMLDFYARRSPVFLAARDLGGGRPGAGGRRRHSGADHHPVGAMGRLGCHLPGRWLLFGTRTRRQPRSSSRWHGG